MLHALLRDKRHADGADDAVVRRNDDPFAEDLRESGCHGVVVGSASLEEDDVADLAAADDAVQIVERDGICESGREVANFRTFEHEGGNVALHEDGAAFAEACGLLRGERFFGEFAFDGDAQLLGLLFEERSGAGGAGFVHGEIDDDAFIEADELRILAADFEDGVDPFHPQLIGDVHGAGFVRGDLVVNGVGADQLANQFTSRAGGAHAEDFETVTEFSFDLSESALHDFNRTALGAEIDFMQQIAGGVDDNEIRGDGTDVDAQIRGDAAAVHGERNVFHAITEESDLLHAEWFAAREGLFAGVLLELMNTLEGALARFGGFEHRSAERAEPRVELGDEELVFFQFERLLHRNANSLVLRDATNESDGWNHVAAFDNR